ncbi:hypothetical protein T06_7226 [Trichinella sp. T6]|nr:hypothetical protein T06_7226 [Trichinella sp. T6]
MVTEDALAPVLLPDSSKHKRKEGKKIAPLAWQSRRPALGRPLGTRMPTTPLARFSKAKRQVAPTPAKWKVCGSSLIAEAVAAVRGKQEAIAAVENQQNRQFYTVGQFQRPIRVENGGVAALDWLSTLVRQVIGAMGLIYYFAWWRKFVVVLAPFCWNNCCHRLPFDPGHLCSIIRTKAYEKAASRAESGEKKAAWIE